MSNMSLTTLSVRSLSGGQLPPTQTVRLHGAIVTPTRFYDEGTIEITGDRITSVSPVRIRTESDSADIECDGLLCPGFVDTHNHAPFAAFCRWVSPTRPFRSRFDWRGKTRGNVVVVTDADPYYGECVGAPFKAIKAESGALLELTLYGQVRGLIGGATTMVIDADLNPDQGVTPLPGFSRDPSDWPGRVWGVLDVGVLTDAESKAILQELADRRAKLLVHVGEGTDDFSRGEFASLLLRGLLTSETALIHAIALLDTDWKRVKESGASVIWSPQSNFRLYGRSIDIGYVIGAGILVALAPDWTITGSSTVLDELIFVRTRYPWISDEHLLEMVTINAAQIIGMPTLGNLATGSLADILLFPREGVIDRASAATRIVTSTHGDLRLAIVAGVPIYGDSGIMNQFDTVHGPAERIDIPLPDGTVATRSLRLGAGTFADVVKSLAKRFDKKKMRMSPLWEAG
jgi:5-methylthioadenosine/S-adenosylhomocysteine deaminase